MPLCAATTRQWRPLFVAAYFTYDPITLLAAAAPAPSMGSHVYEQAYRRFSNYEVLRDATCEAGTGLVTCTIESEDDYSRLLGFQYVEIWQIFVADGEVRQVLITTREEPCCFSNPFLHWFADNKPDLYLEIFWWEGGPCTSFPPYVVSGAMPDWLDSDKAAECVETSLAAAQEYVESGDFEAP